MARPKKETVDYFPHQCKHGRTMYILEQKYGNDGYAFWFKLLELLGDTAGHYLDLNDDATFEFLQAKTRLGEDICCEILDLLAKLGAIDPELWESKVIWCQNFVDGISDVYRNRRMETPSRPSFYEQKPGAAGVSTDENPQSKVKETKVNESISTGGDDVIVLTADEQEFIETLQGVKGYPLDRAKDRNLYQTLTQRYPELDILDVARDWAAYKLDKPLDKKSNPRSQLNTACKKSLEWGKNLKRQPPKEAPRYTHQRTDLTDLQKVIAKKTMRGL